MSTCLIIFLFSLFSGSTTKAIWCQMMPICSSFSQNNAKIMGKCVKETPTNIWETRKKKEKKVSHQWGSNPQAPSDPKTDALATAPSAHTEKTKGAGVDKTAVFFSLSASILLARCGEVVVYPVTTPTTNLTTQVRFPPGVKSFLLFLLWFFKNFESLPRGLF